MNALANAAADEALLLRDDADGVARLTLNRPAARNALSLALMEELQAALDAIAHDDTVKIVVIAGAGPAFRPGHDLKELRTHPEHTAEQHADSDATQDVVREGSSLDLIERSPSEQRVFAK